MTEPMREFTEIPKTRLLQVRGNLIKSFPGLAKLALLLRYDQEQWMRVVQTRQWREFLDSLPLKKLSVLEISPGPRPLLGNEKVKHYISVDFPEFDITRDSLPEKFDLIIAEQVFEHLRHPYQAAANVRRMLEDDGIFLISTPFLIKIHGHPCDYTRWSEDGLRGFLEDCGFTADVFSWGNRQAVKANLARWREYGWIKNLKNEPDFPVNVWAYARKTREVLENSTASHSAFNEITQ